jgi:desulfoferrodoxin (superoxide reductase-like protein)
MLFCAGFIFHGTVAYANKTTVQIEATESAAVGIEIPIELHVSHQGNSFLHYTKWVYVAIDGKEVKRWTFSGFNKPESENFTREITHTLTGPIKITAEGECNIHGSGGIAMAQVAIK